MQSRPPRNTAFPATGSGRPEPAPFGQEALPPAVAILDGTGTIMAVNPAWQTWRDAGGWQAGATVLGTDYPATCEASRDSTARTAAAGLRDVLAGRRSDFEMTYADGPGGCRLRHLRVTGMARSGPAGVVVTHEDVSLPRQAGEGIDGDLSRTVGSTAAVAGRLLSHQCRRVPLTVANALAAATNPEEIIPRLLQSLCESLGWSTALYWAVDPKERVMRCTEIWSGPASDRERAAALGHGVTFRWGEGFPGQVWMTRQPMWWRDVNTHRQFRRRQAAQLAGVHGTVCFPVQGGDEVFGAIEMFSCRPDAGDRELLTITAAIGSMIGRDMARWRELDRLKQGFIATVSHGLRTPLTSIRASLDLLADGTFGDLPTDATGVVAMAGRETMRMTGLVNDLLALSQMASGGLESDRATVALDAVLARSRASALPLVDQPGINLEK